MKKSRTIIISIIAVATVLIVAAAGIALYKYNGRKQIEKESATANTLLQKGFKELLVPNLTEEASIDLSQSLLLFEKLHDKRGIFISKLCLAMFYSEVDELDEANKYMKDISHIHGVKLDTEKALLYYRLLGFLRMKVDKNYLSALSSEMAAINLIKRIDPTDTLDIFIDLSNMAEAYVDMNQKEKAKKIIKYIEGYKLEPNDSYLSQLYYCKGCISFLEKKYDEAFESLNRGLIVTSNDYITRNTLYSLNILLSVDSARNDFRSYRSHIKQYGVVADSISRCNEKLKTAMVRAQMKLTKMQYEHNAAVSRNKITSLIFAFAITLLISISIILLQKFRRSQISKALAESERERLTEKVNYNALERELLEIRTKNADEKLHEANKENVTMSLKLAASDDNNSQNALKLFETSFRQTDSAFMRYIENTYPSLSKTDVRLVCLIRSGMSSKDITSVLSVTMNSLHTARYRLRKKLGLSPQEDLDLFISRLG
jgi:flagellar basal body-associated protein FliL/DNA-binding CsgD family transcriptional regulator